MRQFLANYVLNVFLKRKANEIMEQIDAAIRAADAWKATVLLDSTSDYKPILVVSLKHIHNYFFNILINFIVEYSNSRKMC